jgi:hypothetical protein
LKHRKSPVNAATLKNRILLKHKDFNEKDRGFKGFHDFLIAAEKTGFVKLIHEKDSIWVQLPDSNFDDLKSGENK